MAINIYCLLALVGVAALRKTKFFLVATQTLIDLIVSGAFAFLFYKPRVSDYISRFCFNFNLVAANPKIGSVGPLDSTHVFS